MTDVTGRKRQSKGTPVGGQFAAENRSESEVDLGQPSDDMYDVDRIRDELLSRKEAEDDLVHSSDSDGTISNVTAKTVASWWHGGSNTENITRLSHGREFSYTGVASEARALRENIRDVSADTTDLEELEKWANARGEVSDIYGGSSYETETAQGVLNRQRVRAFEDAASEAKRRGHLVHVNLSGLTTDEAAQWGVSDNGGTIYRDNPNSERCSVYALGSQPSVQYFYATGDDEAPYVSVEETIFVEGEYRGEGGSSGLVLSEDDIPSHVESTRRLHDDWEERGREVSKQYDSDDPKMKRHRYEEPSLSFTPRTRRKTTHFSDPSSPGQSKVRERVSTDRHEWLSSSNYRHASENSWRKIALTTPDDLMPRKLRKS